MLSCDICPLRQPEVIDGIVVAAHKRSNRATHEDALLATFTPEQKQLWLTFESAMAYEINTAVEQSIRETHCITCHKKPTCTI